MRHILAALVIAAAPLAAADWHDGHSGRWVVERPVTVITAQPAVHWVPEQWTWNGCAWVHSGGYWEQSCPQPVVYAPPRPVCAPAPVYRPVCQPVYQPVYQPVCQVPPPTSVVVVERPGTCRAPEPQRTGFGLTISIGDLRLQSPFSHHGR